MPCSSPWWWVGVRVGPSSTYSNLAERGSSLQHEERQVIHRYGHSMRWAAAAPGCYPPDISASATLNRCCRSAFHSGQLLLRLISTKSSRTNDGSKYSSTSALTFPKVLCGRCLLPSLNARSIRRLKSGRGWERRVGDRPDWRSSRRSQSRTR